MNALDSQLFTMVGDTFGTLRTQLWNTVDEEINLADCDIYRFSTSPISNPLHSFVWRTSQLFSEKDGLDLWFLGNEVCLVFSKTSFVAATTLI